MHLVSNPNDLNSLYNIFDVRYTGLVDSGGNMYQAYRVPDPEAPYPQEYLIDREGRIRHWEIEYDPDKLTQVIKQMIKEQVPVNLKLTPDVQSVPQGGTLGYDLTLTNHTGAKQDFLYYLEEVLPNGSRNFLWGPLPHSLNPEQSVTLQLNEQIPNNSPLGAHSLQMKVTSLQSEIWAGYGFRYEVY